MYYNVPFKKFIKVPSFTSSLAIIDIFYDINANISRSISSL